MIFFLSLSGRFHAHSFILSFHIVHCITVHLMVWKGGVHAFRLRIPRCNKFYNIDIKLAELN